ncbi:MAG: hypothetical protein ABSC53_15785 [Bacteroidota bacterium]
MVRIEPAPRCFGCRQPIALEGFRLAPEGVFVGPRRVLSSLGCAIARWGRDQGRKGFGVETHNPFR